MDRIGCSHELIAHVFLVEFPKYLNGEFFRQTGNLNRETGNYLMDQGTAVRVPRRFKSGARNQRCLLFTAMGIPRVV